MPGPVTYVIYVHISCEALRTFGGTPSRDLCSLWGLIWGLPREGLYNDYIRVIYVNGIKGPY